MPTTRPTFFDETGIKVINRDDGTVHLEVHDRIGDGGLLAILPFTPDAAIEIGAVLVEKGTNLRNEMQAIAESADAWRDRNGRIWHGSKGDGRMHPADADSDMGDHSWDEVSTYFGPLTPVKIDG